MGRTYKIEIALFIAALAIFETILAILGSHPTLREMLSHFLVLLISIFLAFILVLYRARKVVSCVWNYFKVVDSDLKIPINALIVKEMDKFFQQIKDIATTGLELNEIELRFLVSECFESNNSKYKGTDSHPPSSFYRLYPTYLQSQATKRETSEDIRLLLVSQDALINDLTIDPTISDRFYTWHVEKRLLQVDPAYASAQATTHQLPACDIGIFNSKYIIFFSPIARANSNMYRVWLWPYTKNNKKLISNYLVMLNKNAYEVRYINKMLQFHQRDLETNAEDEKLLVH